MDGCGLPRRPTLLPFSVGLWFRRRKPRPEVPAATRAPKPELNDSFSAPYSRLFLTSARRIHSISTPRGGDLKTDLRFCCVVDNLLTYVDCCVRAGAQNRPRGTAGDRSWITPKRWKGLSILEMFGEWPSGYDKPLADHNTFNSSTTFQPSTKLDKSPTNGIIFTARPAKTA